MRKSLWMIPVVLLFTALGSPSAHADTIISSGTNVTAIDGITIAGTTYNVTFGTTEDTTFAGNLTNATLAAQAIANDLSTPTIYLTAGGFSYLGVDGGTYAPSICAEVAGACTAGGPEPWGFVGDNVSAVYESTDVVPQPGPLVYGWSEFSTVSTPEPATLTLTLTGVGLLGLMVVMRKRKALGVTQAA